MFQQKSRALVLALIVLTWAPIASAAETQGLFDGLMQQVAAFLGLADEAGTDWVPSGFTGDIPNDEAGPDFMPWGVAQPAPAAIELPADEGGPTYLPGG